MRHHWRLLSTLLVLAVVLGLFGTMGGRQVFVAEMLSEAYDSQAEHLLRGDVDVDGAAIRHEAMVVNGRSRMYFGPFPALLRIPLNAIYPDGRGKWSRLSVFCAGMIALGSFALMVRDALAKTSLSPVRRDWLAALFAIGFALASPLVLLLTEASIYNEAIIWGLAGALGALWFAFRAHDATARTLDWNLAGFSLSAGAALLARITFGVALLPIAFVLAARIAPTGRIRSLLALILPLGTALAFHILISYARFGSITGVNYQAYINPTHREFAHAYGTINLKRVPFALAEYFRLRPPSVEGRSPFFRAEREPYALNGMPWLSSVPVSEVYLSILWCSGWLVGGAVAGTVFLLRKQDADIFERVLLASLALQCLLILAYFALAQRYAADFYPFLVAAFVVFLVRCGALVWRLRYLSLALVLICICVNTLTTISWLAERDQNVPEQSRAAWRRLLRR